jgi:hypothetical protein
MSPPTLQSISRFTDNTATKIAASENRMVASTSEQAVTGESAPDIFPDRPMRHKDFAESL